MPHADPQTHADWGTASLTMAWKLTEQEMKERKLDLETFRSRRVVRHAINTEAVLNIPEEQCNDQFTWEAQTGFPASARARMRAHVEELLAAAPNPAPPGHLSTAPFWEEIAKLGDGSLRCCRYITKFDVDAQEVVAEFVIRLRHESETCIRTMSGSSPPVEACPSPRLESRRIQPRPLARRH